MADLLTMPHADNGTGASQDRNSNKARLEDMVISKPEAEFAGLWCTNGPHGSIDDA